ncbi:MAG: PEGA domain-containing protein [Bradymonadales bacterium]|nr:PEGA domain-containing protein [Bradymonadales bacterium]
MDLVRDGGVLPAPILFGKYYLLEKIATGGMAEIFKAKAFGVEGFERLLAVKRLLSTISEDAEFISMFIDEAKIAGRLNHANIAQIFDLGKADGSYYIALEYVSGQDARTIFDRCRRTRKKLGVDMACYTTMKVCEGLDYAHNKGDTLGNPLHIVHRDVSPQNILVSYEGEVKLIDFGIAKAVGKSTQTQVGILKGKFSYMSPEQVRGLTLDRRSDVFSLCICLYELLTSERLFLGDSDFETLERIRKVEVTPPSLYNPHIPKELEDIVLRGLAKDPNTRFQTAHEMQQALQKFMFNQSFHFTNKDLAANMQTMFAEELRLEKRKIEYYQTLDLDTIRRQTGAASPSAVKRGTGSNLDWDEDEVPTTVWDRPEEEADMAVVMDDFDYSGEEDWVAGADTALDSLPPPPVMTAGEPTEVHSEEYQDAWDRILGSQQELRTLDLEPPVRESHKLAYPPVRPVPPTGRHRSSLLLLIALVALALGLGAGGAYFLFIHPSKIKLIFETQPPQVQILLNNETIFQGATPYTLSGVKEGHHTLTILADGYEPKSREVDLRRGESYSITWALTPLPSTPSPLRISTIPPGATIWIDGTEIPQRSPVELTQLQRGPHTLRLTAEGYQDVTEAIVIGDQPVQVDRRLIVDQYRLVLDVQPAQARFWLSEGERGTEVASGQVTDPIPPLDGNKSYLLIVEADNFHREAQIIEPSSEPERLLQLALRPIEGQDSTATTAQAPSQVPQDEAQPLAQEQAQEPRATQEPAQEQPEQEEDSASRRERDRREQDRRERERAERERAEREQAERERAEQERAERERAERERAERERQAPQEPAEQASTSTPSTTEQAPAQPEPEREPSVATVQQPDTAALPGRLSVGSRPTARVYLSGRDIGFTPIRNLELAPGQYEVRLVNEEFGLDYTRSVQIRPDEEERVIYRLD